MCIRDSIYAMARVFKKFNVHDGNFEPVQPRNVILYAGDYHALHYRFILDKLGFVQQGGTGNNVSVASRKDVFAALLLSLTKNGCINLDNIKTPFFS